MSAKPIWPVWLPHEWGGRNEDEVDEDDDEDEDEDDDEDNNEPIRLPSPD
jgi:hypothetical protein